MMEILASKTKRAAKACYELMSNVITPDQRELTKKEIERIWE